MTNDELNQYILHYLTEDKTNSAIMLTGAWGTGKSYYIQHSLKPFLEKEENGKHQCVVVSLYGLKDTAEISKSIYIATRLKFLNGSSEKATATKFVGKTIIKSVAGFFGVDLSTDEGSLQQLYESVDLDGKLIILEDLERSGIDVIEVLGYVNNLVEQDEVKVLLVANENEIIKTTKKPGKGKDGKDTIITVYTTETEEYLRKKEKTVSDTILFVGNIDEALNGILKSFNCQQFNRMIEQEDSCIVDEIKSVTKNVKSDNLRSIIFGCQKTADIFEYADLSLNIHYLQNVLLGNIAFALRWKNGGSSKWDQNDAVYSQTLGTYQYPLAFFSYNYMVNQVLNIEDLKKYNRIYCDQESFKMTQNAIREHLNTIYGYYAERESAVVSALDKITKNLESTEDIPCSEFGRLANYFVSLKHIVGQDELMDRCKNAMILRLQKNGNKDDEEHLKFHSGCELETEAERKELSAWINEMLDVLHVVKKSDLCFDYQTNSISDFYSYVCQHENDFINKRAFAKLFDVKKLAETLRKSSSSQIHDIRGSFLAIYHFSNISDFYSDDKEALCAIKEEVDSIIADESITDKIIKKQLTWFSGNLQSIIDRL